MIMPVPQRHTFETRDQLAQALAAQIAEDLDQAVQKNGHASLAVSGGSTPALLFSMLSDRDIAWSKVTVTLVDERWVGDTDPRSNAKLVKGTLLNGKAQKATFLPLFNGNKTPETGADDLEAELGKSVSWPLDVAVLGMGTDAHTASFFPGGDRLGAALDENGSKRVTGMRAAGAGEPRITLTLPVLLAAHRLVLHIEGEEKRHVLDQALQEGPVEDMPVRAVLRGARHEPLDIYWAP